MKKYLTLLLVFALVAAGFFGTSVYAMDLNHPKPSPEFGQHVASMAPEHPRIYGSGFGYMISNMAQGNTLCH